MVPSIDKNVNCVGVYICFQLHSMQTMFEHTHTHRFICCFFPSNGSLQATPHSIWTAKIPAPIDFRSLRADSMTILIAPNANTWTHINFNALSAFSLSIHVSVSSFVSFGFVSRWFSSIGQFINSMGLFASDIHKWICAPFQMRDKTHNPLHRIASHRIALNL